jgi:hypothetical protein
VRVEHCSAQKISRVQERAAQYNTGQHGAIRCITLHHSVSPYNGTRSSKLKECMYADNGDIVANRRNVTYSFRVLLALSILAPNLYVMKGAIPKAL